MTSLLYMLDTNCLIDIRRGRMPVIGRFRALPDGVAVQSVITYGELVLGVAKSQRRAEAEKRLKEVARLVPVVPLATDAAVLYANTRALLERAGKVIGGNDLWIAAHAIALDLILVTNNEREFSRVPGLKFENWAAPA